jgi:2-polyprenyl-3-methyl-5-hydroxy-6-metoxy-1,4-benzoquinol methylase
VSACSACGSPALRPHLRVVRDEARDLVPTIDRYGHALADIARCGTCGHMQLERFPSEDELVHAYEEATDDETYVEEEHAQRLTARVAVERIERYAPGRRLVDLGCWVGFLVDEARRRGWDAEGVEPSDYAHAYATQQLGLRVHHADLFHADVERRAFDAVTLHDVVEHLVRPGDALDRMAELLRPGGVVHIATPNAGSALARRMGSRWWSVLPTHVQYFTRASLRTLLERHGYEVLWMGTAPKTFSVRYYLWRLEGYSPAVSRAAIGTAEAVRMADRLWTPDFRDRMAVVARGPS